MRRAKAITRIPLLLTVSLVCAVPAEETPVWQIEMVDTSGAVQSSSMKIDRDGNVHVCYVVGQAGSLLKYAFWDHRIKKWFVMVVDQNPNACSLTLDSKQRPHISYADYGTAEGARLHYAYWDGTSWKKKPIALNAVTIASHSSIGLDAEDRPTIAFYEYRGPRGTDYRIRLRTVRWNGKGWELRTVDGNPGSGKVNHMVADARGRFHLAYADVGLGEMRYAYWNGEKWELETVESKRQNNEQYVGLACAVAVDREGNPHVAYMNVTALQMKYAVRRNGRWAQQTLDQLAGISEDFDRSGIVLDPAGRPYISFFDAGLGVLKLAHLEEDKWVIETVDSGGTGFANSVQIDRGVIWISYADMVNNALKVARRKADRVEISKTVEAETATAEPAVKAK